MIYHDNAPKILKAIAGANNILLISHENPDGDTLGASLAVSHFLTQTGKNHKHFCADKPAAYFDYLPKIENITNNSSDIKLGEYDLVIAIDCGDIKRTGLENELKAAKDSLTLINIDHHQSNNHYGHLNLVAPHASSTCEIIYNFLDFHNIAIDNNMANCILTGILTDTMNFTNAATNQESILIAGKLIKKGAKINKIINQITQTRNLSALKLWGEVLSRLEYNNEHNFAAAIIYQVDLQNNQMAGNEARDGLANFLTTLEGVDFILVLTEEEGDLISGSLRTTKDHINVGQLAQSLGGGGHQKAAGFKLDKKKLGAEHDWKNLAINAIINKLEVRQ